MHNLAPIDQREDLATKGYVDDAVGAVEAPYGLSVSGNLSSAGWYRVLTFTNTNAAYQRGATGAEVVFHITRRRISSGEESHEIKMLCTYDDVGFLGELSKTFSGTQKIDKIRYTYDADGAHVDIHVNDASPAVCVSFEIYCEPDRRSMYTAASLESVADAPAGETVLITHEFSVTTIVDISDKFALNSSISGISGYVTAIFDASTHTVDVSFSAYSSATFGTSTAIAVCTDSRYRPKSGSNGNGMIHNKTSGEWYPYKVVIDTSGNITQGQTGSADRVYGHISYKI